jgi:signal transduction histidine kinase
LSELRPRILDDYGLVEAIEWLGRQFTKATGIPVKFTTPEKDIKVSEEIANSIFRICQEAFTNITRYSQAKNISNSIKIIEETIVFTIEDDGIGFDPHSIQTKRSFGILGMRERVLALGGKFELVSSPGKGTKIIVSLPRKL